MDPRAIYNSLPLTIHQVEQVTGVSKSTLRFWEKTFDGYLEVERTRGRQRQYPPSSVQRVLTLKTLLRDEMYTIHGAKRKLGLAEENLSAAAGE
ncbi:MAG: MerR family transcriptional regulator [Planctomycetes bacterium]|nr:MerR family transcriptional regulator [Planctomycetota bacterium]